MQLNLSGLALPLHLRPASALTDEEMMRFSRRNKPYKIERNRQGEITVMTPVGGIGSTHEVFVASALFQWAEADGRGIAFGSNAGFNLCDGSCLSPDAAWLSLEQWKALSAEQQAGFPPVCPEFIVEIRSRSDSCRLLQAKMQLWLDNGAQLAWLLDPEEGTATIFHPGRATESSARLQSLFGSGPVAGFELRCARLWPAF